MLYLSLLGIVLWGAMLYFLMRAVYIDLKTLRKISNLVLMQKDTLHNTPYFSGCQPKWINLLDAFFIFVSLLICFFVMLLLLLVIDYQ